MLYADALDTQWDGVWNSGALVTIVLPFTNLIGTQLCKHSVSILSLSRSVCHWLQESKQYWHGWQLYH